MLKAIIKYNTTPALPAEGPRYSEMETHFSDFVLKPRRRN